MDMRRIRFDKRFGYENIIKCQKHRNSSLINRILSGKLCGDSGFSFMVAETNLISSNGSK